VTKKSTRCFGCLNAFPPPPKGKEAREGAEQQKRAEGASESSRYECPSCERHFCVDCDVFCHEVVHNCPGCTSGGGAGIDQESGSNGDGDVVMNGNGHENGSSISSNGNGIAVA
jgi:transcription initiation factor TFIIH subunit 2